MTCALCFRNEYVWMQNMAFSRIWNLALETASELPACTDSPVDFEIYASKLKTGEYPLTRERVAEIQSQLAARPHDSLSDA